MLGSRASLERVKIITVGNSLSRNTEILLSVQVASYVSNIFNFSLHDPEVLQTPLAFLFSFRPFVINFVPLRTVVQQHRLHLVEDDVQVRVGRLVVIILPFVQQETVSSFQAHKLHWRNHYSEASVNQ